MRKIEKRSLAIALVAIICIVLLPGVGSSAQEEKPERETIQATALGQSTQLGKVFNVNIMIEEYSTADDQMILYEAFNAAGMKGLSNALGKMKSKGRLSITGTLGYEINYIRSFKTETGRKIRIVTNRPITIGESWSDSRSSDYNLSALEIDISSAKGKSTGVLLPACQFKIDKDKQLAIENYQNPWKLANILER